MKLVPINKNIDILKECGYDTEIEYDNPRFHGHQKGVAICLINKETGAVEENMLREKLGDKRRDELLKLILESRSIVKVVHEFTQFENGAGTRLVPKQIFYLPYIVEDHSFFKPTINYDNVCGATNVQYELDIEILFVHENLNRYITAHMRTVNVSIMDGIYGLFEEGHVLQEELLTHGIVWKEEEDEEGLRGFVVDFYDEAGNSYTYGFPSGERLRDTIASVRLIGLKMDIVNEEETSKDDEESPAQEESVQNTEH